MVPVILSEAKDLATTGQRPPVGDPAFIEAAYAGRTPITRYLVRVLVDGSPAAAALFDEIVRLTEEYLTTSGHGTDEPAEPGTLAAVLAAMKLGVVVFEDHLARVLDVCELAPDGYPRIARAMLGLLSGRVVSPELAAQARVGLDRYERAARARPSRRRVEGGR